MLNRIQFTDDDRQRITERMRELARFEKGDRVTVEPHDHDFAVAGDSYIGIPLVVTDVCWNGNDLVRVDGDQHRMQKDYRPDDYQQRHVSIGKGEQVDLEGSHVPETVYITTIKYSFRDVDGDRVHPQPEGALIHWQEYREDHDRVHLEERRDGRYTYLEKAGDDEKDCPVCGGRMRKVSGHDQKVVHIGAESCAACGYCFDHWD